MWVFLMSAIKHRLCGSVLSKAGNMSRVTARKQHADGSNRLLPCDWGW